ncbi:unnamed protein product, partial [Musa acuminata subsp. burmannicoides]
CLRCTNPRRSVRSVLICFLSKAEAEAKLLLTPPVAMSNLIICPSSNHLPPPLFSSTVGLSACTHDSPDPRALGVFSQSPLLPPSVFCQVAAQVAGRAGETKEEEEEEEV